MPPLNALRRELWVLKQLDWNMRIVTPFEPLSLLSVILDLADAEVPGEPSIVECAGTFVAVSVTQHRGQVSPAALWWGRYSLARPPRTNGFGFRAALVP